MDLVVQYFIAVFSLKRLILCLCAEFTNDLPFSTLYSLTHILVFLLVFKIKFM